MKTKIPNEIIPLAYKLSKEVYEKKITFSKARIELVGDNNMSLGSTGDFFNNFKYMIEGKKFTRTLNAYSIEYLLENIYKDYGFEKLSNALSALKKHIEYYEGIRKVKMNTMRNIYEQCRLKLLIKHLKEQEQDEQEQTEIIQELGKEKKSKEAILQELINLKETDPELIIINGKAYKRDNKTIAQLKILRDFKCQICGTSIKKRDGKNYIEAAHIIPKHEKGCELLTNIILLCPNHHKEFDLGESSVTNHTSLSVDITINGKKNRIFFIPDL